MEYKTTAEPRCSIDGIPVFCAYDDIVQIGQIKPNPKNPNTHPESQVKMLADIIHSNGWRNNITVSTRSGLVVRGHGRLLAAQRLALSSVPVEYQKYASESEELADLAADNRLSELSVVDDDLLSELLDMITDDVPLELAGYEDALNALIDGSAPVKPDTPADSSEVPADPSSVPPRTRPGDVWTLGRHRLMCGNSTSMSDVQTLAGGGVQIDLLLTDPPYGVAYVGKTADALTIENDSIGDDEAFTEFLCSAFSSATAVMRPGACFYIWHAPGARQACFFEACNKAGLPVRQQLIWKKNSLVLGHSDYHYIHEPCLYGWKPGAAHTWKANRSQTTVLEFDRPTASHEHPTMKPVEMFEYLIENNTTVNDNVLDLFSGSGTTVLACEKTNRTAFSMELDPKFCDVIVSRWEQMTGLEAVLN